MKSIDVFLWHDSFNTGLQKIDEQHQRLVQRLNLLASHMAFQSNIIPMVQSLNFSIIAEGGETEEQRQLLLNKGCTHYQGYLFSKPIPIKQFEILLRQGFAVQYE